MDNLANHLAEEFLGKKDLLQIQAIIIFFD
jgi:hypothetical protein